MRAGNIMNFNLNLLPADLRDATIVPGVGITLTAADKQVEAALRHPRQDAQVVHVAGLIASEAVADPTYTNGSNGDIIDAVQAAYYWRTHFAANNIEDDEQPHPLDIFITTMTDEQRVGVYFAAIARTHEIIHDGHDGN